MMGGLASNPDEGKRGQGAAVKRGWGENPPRVRRRKGKKWIPFMVGADLTLFDIWL